LPLPVSPALQVLLAEAHAEPHASPQVFFFPDGSHNAGSCFSDFLKRLFTGFQARLISPRNRRAHLLSLNSTGPSTSSHRIGAIGRVPQVSTERAKVPPHSLQFPFDTVPCRCVMEVSGPASFMTTFRRAALVFSLFLTSAVHPLKGFESLALVLRAQRWFSFTLLRTSLIFCSCVAWLQRHQLQCGQGESLLRPPRMAGRRT